jgi:speckle-type POZ protein
MASFAQVETTSGIQAKTISGSHLYNVLGYSLTKGIGVGRCINSDVFTIGGYDWIIRYYPDGRTNKDKNFISLYLKLKSAMRDVRVIYSFYILQQNGSPSDRTQKSESQVTTFNSTTAACFSSWGCDQFANRNEIEASECLKNDALTLKCTVTVVKMMSLRAINPYGVVVPPSTLNQNLASMLESGKGADVTFLVKGEQFNAHRCVLAARSAVFNAMFFSFKKDKGTQTILVDEIEAPVFKYMLHFIYSDSLPSLEEKQDLWFMAQHLLVAADRYVSISLFFCCYCNSCN